MSMLSNWDDDKKPGVVHYDNSTCLILHQLS